MPTVARATAQSTSSSLPLSPVAQRATSSAVPDTADAPSLPARLFACMQTAVA